MSEELIQLELAQITAEATIQARVEMNAATITAYYERMVAGDAFTPIVVFDDGETLWLADGFHRLAAAKRAIRPKIDARVMKGSRAEAAWFALGANRTNGLPMSTADKARSVKQALLMRPEASNRVIADHIGVSDHTVAKYRHELESTAQIAQCSMRETSDGRLHPAHKAVAEDDPPPSPPSTTVQTEDEPPPVDDPPPVLDDPLPPTDEPLSCIDDQPSSEDEPPVTANIVRDRAGNAVADPGLIELFKRGHEIVELCTAVSRIKSTVLNACKQDDPLFAYINTGAFEAEATNLYRQIAHTRPHAVCPYCHNDDGRTTCNACKGLGWVNEAIYTHAPAEKKQRRF